MVALFPHLGDSFGPFLPLSSALAHPLLIWQLGGPQEWMTPYIVGPTTQLVAEIRNICSWVFSSYASWLIWLPPNPLVIKSEGPLWILCGHFLVHFWDILSSWPHLCSPGNFFFLFLIPPMKSRWPANFGTSLDSSLPSLTYFGELLCSTISRPPLPPRVPPSKAGDLH